MDYTLESVATNDFYHYPKCTIPILTQAAGEAGQWEIEVTLDNNRIYKGELSMWCPIDYFSMQDGATSYYSCHACGGDETVGAICPAGTTVRTMGLQKDYWRASLNTPVIYPCTLENACVGMSVKRAQMANSTSAYCKTGYFGPFCGTCKTGWFMNWATGECNMCNNKENFMPAIMLCLTAAGLVLICAVVFFFKRGQILRILEERKQMLERMQSELQDLVEGQAKKRFSVAALGYEKLRDVQALCANKLAINIFTFQVRMRAPLKSAFSSGQQSGDIPVRLDCDRL